MSDVRQPDLIDKLFQILFFVAYRLKLVYNFLLSPTAEGVYIAVWCNGRVLIIKNSYKHYLTFPCGGLNHYERPEEGAVRELFEEVGIRGSATDLNLVGSFFSRVEYMDDHITLYEIYLSQQPQIQCDNREVTWASFERPEKVLKSETFPLVRDYLNARTGFKYACP